MKRFLSIMVVCLGCAIASATNIEDVFKSMNDEWVLSEECRLKMLQVYHSTRGQVDNGFNGYSQIALIDSLSQGMLIFTNSSELSISSSIELKLFVIDGDTIVGRAFNVGDSIVDSRIDFYTTDWKEIPCVNHVAAKAFVNGWMVNKEKFQVFERWHLPLMMSADIGVLGLEEGDVSFVWYTSKLMSEEQREMMKGVFKEGITCVLHKNVTKGGGISLSLDVLNE